MTKFRDLHAQWLATDPAYRAEIERIEAMGWEAFSAEQREMFAQADEDDEDEDPA